MRTQRKRGGTGLPLDVLVALQNAAGEAVARGDAGKLTAEQIRVATMRAVTGVLASQPQERDLKFDSFSVQVGGNHLITDCRLELNQGCRYGLIGQLAVCA